MISKIFVAIAVAVVGAAATYGFNYLASLQTMLKEKDAQIADLNIQLNKFSGKTEVLREKIGNLELTCQSRLAECQDSLHRLDTDSYILKSNSSIFSKVADLEKNKVKFDKCAIDYAQRGAQTEYVYCDQKSREIQERILSLQSKLSCEVVKQN